MMNYRKIPRRFQQKIISVKCIWDYAKHNGMTDLIEYQNTLFCCFREGLGHKGDNGSIRILKCNEKGEWKSAAFLSKPGIDLRDPHLSIMPNGQLMLTLGGSTLKEKKYQGCCPHVAFSSDGIRWSDIHQIPLPEEWIWRITWRQSKGYGFSYRLSEPQLRNRRWILTLFETEDGLTYTPIKEIKVSNHPSEATIRFTPEGQAIALLRRRGHAWIGNSFPPYKEWKWEDSGYYIGGPNFLILPDGTMWGGGRDYYETDDSKGYTTGRTAIGPLTLKKYSPSIFLPSKGDNSYPGFVYKNGILYVSYYSYEKNKTCIYLAEIKL